MHNNYARGLPPKNWLVALLLSVFVGGFGVDRFYLGQPGLGIAKFFLSWATFGIWWAIDILMIATRNLDDSGFYWDDQPREWSGDWCPGQEHNHNFYKTHG